MRTIEEIKADIDVLESLWSNYTDTIDYDSDDCDLALRNALNLLYAERDGRCVVLPCKVGDTVYWADTDGDEALELPLMGYWVTVFSDGEKKIDGCVQAFGRNCSKPFGTCLFLTREEAEQALKGGAE